MKLQLTFLAVVAAGVWSTTPMAQGTSHHTRSYVDTIPMYSGSHGWPSSGDSPNSYKAQNSDMRAQGGYGTYVNPGDTVYVYPANPIWVDPTASSRGVPVYSGSHGWPSSGDSPNSNQAQNSDMRAQGGYGTYVIPGNTVQVYPARPIWIESTASRRGVPIYSGSHGWPSSGDTIYGPTHSVP